MRYSLYCSGSTSLISRARTSFKKLKCDEIHDEPCVSAFKIPRQEWNVYNTRLKDRSPWTHHWFRNLQLKLLPLIDILSPIYCLCWQQDVNFISEFDKCAFEFKTIKHLYKGMWDTASNHLVRDQWAVDHNLPKIDGVRDGSVEEEVLEKIRKV